MEISRFSARYDVRELGEADADDILDLCRANTLYYQYCGAEATREQVLGDLRAVPSGVAASHKHYVGFFREGALAAVMDLIDGYPRPEVAYIGFFMVNAALQGRGVGSDIIREVCAYLRQIGKTAVRLGIAEDNPQANHFWRKNGFRVIDRVQMDGWVALVAEREELGNRQ